MQDRTPKEVEVMDPTGHVGIISVVLRNPARQACYFSFSEQRYQQGQVGPGQWGGEGTRASGL